MINLIINLLDDITKQAFENSSFMRELTTIICKKLGYHESVSLIDSLCSFFDDLHRTITSNGPKIVRIERTPEEIKETLDQILELLEDEDGDYNYREGTRDALEWVLGRDVSLTKMIR